MSCQTDHPTSHPTSHLTSLDFDRLEMGSLEDARADLLRSHVAGCPACSQEQERRRRLADQFAREVLPRSLPVIRQRLEGHRRWKVGWRMGWRVSWRMLALAPVACGVLLAIVFVGGRRASVDKPSGNPPAISDDLASKGGAGLVTYVRQGNQVTRLGPGRVLGAGDALRFAIEPGPNRYLLIAGVDATGRATAYYPFGQWKGLPVHGGGRWEIPGSIVLDDSVGPERIFAVLSQRPVDGQQVRSLLESLGQRGAQAIRATATLSLPGAETPSIVFEKREKTP